MSERNTLIRSMHDLGLAAWFGGNLMGAVGLNGGAAEATDPRERLRLSSAGWAKWAPVQLAALVVHGIGGAGLIIANKSRLASQPEARRNTVVKLAVTGAAVASTVYSGILGMKIASHADEGATGVTEPAVTSSNELASAQSQQKVLQWVTPALTAVLLVLSAQQGEQQRPFAGLLRSRLREIAAQKRGWR
jgi:succinate dehydrogenase hydrophobic anchor subunit